MEDGSAVDEVRVEVRIKNNRLWEAIVPAFGSVAEFCRRSGLRQIHVGALINLRASPLRSGGRPRERDDGTVDMGRNPYTPTANRLAEICGYSCEELFPLDLYARAAGKAVVKTMTIARALALADFRETSRAMENNGEDYAIGLSRRRAVRRAMRSLPVREKGVARMRFGLDRDWPLTLREVGKSLCRTDKTVRQIENKVVRLLRHPSRGKELRDHFQY